jgi:hypothetical protein
MKIVNKAADLRPQESQNMVGSKLFRLEQCNLAGVHEENQGLAMIISSTETMRHLSRCLCPPPRAAPQPIRNVPCAFAGSRRIMTPGSQEQPS